MGLLLSAALAVVAGARAAMLASRDHAMGMLLLVRHGQASVFADDYDKLSSLGEQQAALLGEHWARRGVAVDLVFHGPRARQRRTEEVACMRFAALGGAWPVATLLDGLDEMAGDVVFRDTLPSLMAEHDEVRRLGEAFHEATARRLAAGVEGHGHALADEALRTLDRLFQNVMHRWIDGQIEGGHVEPWARFRARVGEALSTMLAAAGRGQTVAAFTSAGTIAAAVGAALGLDDARTLELMFQVKNSSVTELRFSGSRFSLHAFNGTPHLAERALETMR
jgi:broad specificity phosphatase PhoE